MQTLRTPVSLLDYPFDTRYDGGGDGGGGPLRLHLLDRGPTDGETVQIPGVAPIQSVFTNGAGHFLQDDKGVKLAEAVAALMTGHPTSRF